MAVLDRHDHRLLGRCCLQRARDLPEIEVGFAFERQSWGRGLATEALRVTLTHGFETLGLSTVVAWVHPDNHRSQRLLNRHGFILEATGFWRGKCLHMFRLDRQTWAE